jgi:hypothetical protein
LTASTTATSTTATAVASAPLALHHRWLLPIRRRCHLHSFSPAPSSNDRLLSPQAPVSSTAGTNKASRRPSVCQSPSLLVGFGAACARWLCCCCSCSVEPQRSRVPEPGCPPAYCSLGAVANTLLESATGGGCRGGWLGLLRLLPIGSLQAVLLPPAAARTAR